MPNCQINHGSHRFHGWNCGESTFHSVSAIREIRGSLFSATTAVSLSCVSLFAGFASQRSAGGGPENVLLVVNANSESSKTIANHYIELRKIPPTNVLYLDWTGNLEMGSAENLRNKILTPSSRRSTIAS